MRAADGPRGPATEARRVPSARARRTASGVWRWRHSPLCRPTDRAEAWVALVALVLIGVAAPAVGLVTGLRANASLQREVVEQHRERHATTGTVLRPAREGSRPGGAQAGAGYAGPVTVPASWTAPDGSARTGRVATVRGSAEPGDTFPLWTDDRGRLVNRPVTASTATAQAALTGFGAGAVSAGLAHCVRLLVVRRLMRRRYERLDRAWAKVGPEWGRAGTGG
ncbi:Rv1733c family protein [Streptomyces cremeus]|uniref:Integral membrane protein n=1 Tax=Streptomyces cremeus TaxID=66881 RepID=A0ABV5P7K3_STRCM